MKPGGALMAASPRRIAVRGVNWLGDAVMTTPALQRLREQFPNAHIALLTREKLADLWRGHPAIDSVLEFGAKESPWAIARRLRSLDFDWALILPNSPRSALEAWLAGIPKRIGYGRGLRRWLLTVPVSPRPDQVPMRKRSVSEVRRLTERAATSPLPRYSPGAHHIYQYLHLTAALGANAAPLPPRLWIDKQEIVAATEKFGLSGSVLGLNAGAEYGPAKRWPADRFVAAALAVQQQAPQVRWLILGGPGDTALAGEITGKLNRALEHAFPGLTEGRRPVNVAGRTSLRELLALLAGCRAVLTNDTGPMHLAAAVGRPVVVPFGSTAPGLTGPGLPGDSSHQLLQGQAACAPCFLRVCPIDFRCMQSISVAAVSAAVLRVLDGNQWEQST